MLRQCRRQIASPDHLSPNPDPNPGGEHMSLKTNFVAAAVAAVVGSASLFATTAHAADDVVMRINFTPWGMHAQYFAGQAQGFYEEAGINIEIRPPSAGQLNEA